MLFGMYVWYVQVFVALWYICYVVLTLCFGIVCDVRFIH